MARAREEAGGSGCGTGNVGFFRPFGACSIALYPPTAYAPSTSSGRAVGCILSLVRGWDLIAMVLLPGFFPSILFPDAARGSPFFLRASLRRSLAIHSLEYMVPRHLLEPQWQGAGSSSS